MSPTPEEVTLLREARRLLTQVIGDSGPAPNVEDWRSKPVSEKQTAALKKLGYSLDGLNRGKAAEILDHAFKEKTQ